MTGAFLDIVPKDHEFFPGHGWIVAASGMKQLRLPILRLYQDGTPTHARIVARNSGGTWLQARSPYRTLRQLAIGMRDIHREIRHLQPLLEADWYSQDMSDERNDAITRIGEGYEQVGVDLIAVFVLLRRLADELIDASGPFLFDRGGSAPKDLKRAIRRAKAGEWDDLRPICDLNLLSDALLNHTAWWEQLRETGIRDTLVHKPHILQIGGSGVKAPNEVQTTWMVSASLVTFTSQGPQSVDLLSALRDCVAGACTFMEMLYRAVAVAGGTYATGDALILTGSTNDVVGFWPTITAADEEFPLTR